MGPNSLRSGAALGVTSSSHTKHHPSRTPSHSNDTLNSRRRRRPANLSAFAATATILVSSILVSSPAMIAPVSASYIPHDVSSVTNAYQHAFAAWDQPNHVASASHSLHLATPRPPNPNTSSHPSHYPSQLVSASASLSSLSSSSSSPSLSSSSLSSSSLSSPSLSSSSLSSSSSSSPSHSSVIPHVSDHTPASSTLDDIHDHLPQTSISSPPLHRQYPRQYDDESALFGERDLDMTTTHSPLQFDEVSTPTSTHTTASAHRYSLPSTYASSIASSWSRPKRSVWFQQKAIIITSIFLAIFIVLFIGAAVFLRERKFDDELANLDDGEALARIEERMTMGRFSDPIEKQDERDAPRQSFKKKLKLGRNKARDKDQSLLDPSSGSSSAIRRKRHLVSRWTLINLRDTNDTIRATSDTASIRSGHSARQAALGDPRAQENVQITYHSHAPEIPGTDADAHNALHLGSNDIANTSNSLSDQPTTSDRRPRSPPPPHPDGDSSEVRSSSSDPDNTNAESDARSPRRIALDDSDFQAADAHDDMLRHMPPAYIPSGSGAGSSYDPAEALAAALVRGDAKHGIPPPEQRDPGVSPQVINAVLTDAVSASQSEECESVGPTTAHVATDDKAVLGALRDGASMPSAPCTAEASAPAYGVSIQEGVGGSSDSESGSVATPSPSAPALELDTDGFEVPPTLPCASTSDAPIDEKRQFGKGKGKQASTLSTLLPEPPRPVETAFSPFDEPYRDTSPPRTSVPPLSPGRISASIDASAETVSALPAGASDDVVSARKSDKQKEAEQEQQLAALVASRPEDVPRYERHGPSAPVLDDEAVRGPATPSKRLEHLPAYESRRRRSSVAVLAQARLASTCSPATPDTPSGQDGSTAAPCAPSTPSAPPPEGDEK